jgi:hypothetical protein
MFQNTYERNETHSLENCHDKILVLCLRIQIRIRKWSRKILDPIPKKINSDPQYCLEQTGFLFSTIQGCMYIFDFTPPY